MTAELFDSRRSRAACRLAGLNGWWPHTGEYVFDFVWACEINASPAPERWAFVDRKQLARRARAHRLAGRPWRLTFPPIEASFDACQ